MAVRKNTRSKFIRSKAVIFQYKTQKSALHKVPAVLKLFFLLSLSIICMALPAPALLSGIVLLAVAAGCCRITPREQLADLRPAFFYASLMYFISVFSSLVEILQGSDAALAFAVFLPQERFVLIALRLVFVVQLSALLFRSTSSVELRVGLGRAEFALRRFLRRGLGGVSLKTSCSQSIALFLSFIPEIFESWRQINFAWQGRAGKPGLAKVKTLVFVLISLCMEKASRKAAALEARAGAD
ncbi:MAG: hypothetical protein FWG66_08300 [Spirochaetes bacterium]|nr:hypothetical protein [Spirochaetota bacterium]